jgi:Zn finger protein HypA/HybF involved in hydrogenase expression
MRTKSVKVLPRCDFCGAPAKYDAPTKTGQWAYFCEQCAGRQSTPKHMSIGLEFVLVEEKAIPKPVAQSLEATIISFDLDELIVKCPTCGTEYPLEPDAEEGVCQVCDQMVTVRSPLC